MRDTKEQTFYLCATDWMHELGEAADGTTVYPSLNWLKKLRPCWKSCGVVMVRATFHLEESIPAVQDHYGKPLHKKQ